MYKATDNGPVAHNPHAPKQGTAAAKLYNAVEQAKYQCEKEKDYESLKSNQKTDVLSAYIGIGIAKHSLLTVPADAENYRHYWQTTHRALVMEVISCANEAFIIDAEMALEAAWEAWLLRCEMAHSTRFSIANFAKMVEKSELTTGPLRNALDLV